MKNDTMHDAGKRKSHGRASHDPSMISRCRRKSTTAADARVTMLVLLLLQVASATAFLGTTIWIKSSGDLPQQASRATNIKRGVGSWQCLERQQQRHCSGRRTYGGKYVSRLCVGAVDKENNDVALGHHGSSSAPLWASASSDDDDAISSSVISDVPAATTTAAVAAAVSSTTAFDTAEKLSPATAEGTGTIKQTAASSVPPVIGDIRRGSLDTMHVRPRSAEEDEQAERDAPRGNFVELFRGSAPYIQAHQGATMVVHMGGEVLDDPNFMSLMDDLGLLSLLGVRLVMVTGARPQISLLLHQAGIKEEFRDDLRVTSTEALKAIKAAAGFVRIEVESALTRGGRGSNSINVSGGNYFSAQPVGVRNGVDYGCTGEIRKVEADKISARLSEGGVVQLTCMGYSASGEVFNVDSRVLAAKCAAALGASKLIFIADGAHLEDSATGETIKSLRLSEARSLLARYRQKKRAAQSVPDDQSAARASEETDSPPANSACEAGRDLSAVGQSTTAAYTGVEGGGSGGPDEGYGGLESLFMTLIERGVQSLTEGVSRAHIVPPSSGALLQELYTRDGAGLLISRDIYDGIRIANPRDIPGITEIIAPLEKKGILVARPREQLEADILRNEFFIITRDEAVLGVAFFKRFGHEHAEVGCMAIHHDYRKRGWGEAMLSYLERVALASSVKHIFVLSTVTMQWFVERGFKEAEVSELPPERKKLYNWQRMSKIYLKTLGGGVRAVDAEELLWDVRGMV